MSSSYTEEGFSCKNYVSDFTVVFNYYEEKSGTPIELKEKELNHLFFLLEGEINISCNEFQNHLLTGGEMIFIPQDSKVSGEAYTNIKYLLLGFDNQKSICEQIDFKSIQDFNDNKQIFYKLNIGTPLQRVIDSIRFYVDKKIHCKHLLEAKQLEIFLVLKTFYEERELARFLSSMFNQKLNFKAFVLKHYMEVKSMEELAELYNISVRSLARKFNTYFGDSPYSWIMKQKSLHIKNRLADPKIPLGEIIKEFDFSSQAHFTTYCKKNFGMNPTTLRKELNKK